MPNHITNIITITAPEDRTIQEVLEYVKTEDTQFDFNTLIPMPELIKSSFGVPGISPPWYDWSIKNWGTKWNAYEISNIEQGVKFETAWNAPMPIFKALAEKFPDYSFDFKYADEDTGYNFGHLKIDRIGTLSYSVPEKGTPAANKWVFENVRERPDYYDEEGNFIGEY